MRNIIIIMAVFCFLGCEKEEDQVISPITAENTFSCSINGVTFIPETHGGFIPVAGIIVSVFDNNSWRIILGDDKYDLVFFIKHIDHTGGYELHPNEGEKIFYVEDETGIVLENRTTSETFISTENSGTIDVLSFEGEEKLMFQFDEIELSSLNNPSSTIILTEGKLNINSNTLNQEE
ncbi:hypothetical protein [Zunongwangia atlantica]|uniref:Uncharacterized protein n=1 Tax=Zunongwangia atlantica 22II14-10F7 TaxID=1185767 RepID=A0A1Y1T5A1_9FLAO|nr:hypothetical protein [Zunongwangia atlantica]ORL46229.1 hypothetical protein IIF7_06656 [Zunongwangia atlantica 22II14-10F7]